MNQVLILLALVFLLCFFIYQWWYEQSRNRNRSQAQIDAIKLYNRPKAWAVYSLITFFIILSIIGYWIYKLMFAVIQLNG